MKIEFNYVRCREVLKCRAEEYNKSLLSFCTQIKFREVCGYVRACGIISTMSMSIWTEKIDLGERVDSRRYET